jgi:hypothetical protein
MTSHAIMSNGESLAQPSLLMACALYRAATVVRSHADVPRRLGLCLSGRLFPLCKTTLVLHRAVANTFLVSRAGGQEYSNTRSSGPALAVCMVPTLVTGKEERFLFPFSRWAGKIERVWVRAGPKDSNGEGWRKARERERANVRFGIDSAVAACQVCAQRSGFCWTSIVCA